MKLAGTRILRGPSLYSEAPCIVALVDLAPGDDEATLGDFAQLAVALQREAGTPVDFHAVVPAAAESKQRRVAIGYGIEAVGVRAVDRAAAAFAGNAAGALADRAATVASLRELVAAQAIDDASATLLDAARRRGIPVLRLDEAERVFQLGWGRRQRRVEAGAAGTRTTPPDLDAWFPPGDDGRIPVVAITGTNGKTTTTQLVAHGFRHAGRRTGLTTTQGVFVDDRVVDRGDCTGYWSARAVLTDPEVEVAVLETARGGLLKRGLAFDRCEVGVVLNVSSDHLGLDGVETVVDLARVKGLVARSATRAAVLNADDPHCVAMAAELRPGCDPVWFSMTRGDLPDHPVLGPHIAAGGRVAHCGADGWLTWLGPHGATRVVEAARMPVAMHGHAPYNVANALAAAAALLSAGLPLPVVASALESFVSDARRNPLRGNRFELDGTTLIVDYAHNVAAYRALCAMAHSLLDGRGGRLIGVVTSPGDRRADDLHQTGRVCGECFDELVVYEQNPRGRHAGETSAALLSGARSAAPAKPLHAEPEIRRALTKGLARSRPGDVLVFTCAGTLDDLLEGVRAHDPGAADRIAADIAA